MSGQRKMNMDTNNKVLGEENMTHDRVGQDPSHKDVGRNANRWSSHKDVGRPHSARKEEKRKTDPDSGMERKSSADSALTLAIGCTTAEANIAKAEKKTTKNQRQVDENTDSVSTIAMRFTSSYFSINSWVIDNEIPTMVLVRHFTTNYWLLRAADRAVLHDALKAEDTPDDKKIVESAISDAAWDETPNKRGFYESLARNLKKVKKISTTQVVSAKETKKSKASKQTNTKARSAKAGRDVVTKTPNEALAARKSNAARSSGAKMTNATAKKAKVKVEKAEATKIAVVKAKKA